VPSAGERNYLLIARASDKGISSSLSWVSGYRQLSHSTYTQTFINDFLLPLAGYRAYNKNIFNDVNSIGYFWSSTTDTWSNAHNLYVSSSIVDMTDINNAASLLSVRCFRNIKDTIPPSVEFGPREGNTPAKSRSTIVTVAEYVGAGVDTSSLKYQRTDSTVAPTEASFSSTFSHGQIITKSDGEGTFYLRILAKDNSANTIITRSNAFNVDNTSPTGSISINAGASYTTSTAVTLTLSATDANSMTMCISNTTSCTSRETYTTSKSRTLTAGDGTKTVYVRFQDIAGNVSSQYSDTIILDTTAPTISTVGKSTTAPTNGSVIVTVTATDNGGAGLATEPYSFDNGSIWQAATTKTFTANTNGTIKVRDALGNTSSTDFSITNIDTTAPYATNVNYNPDAPTNGNVIVTITLSET
jgi:hypothetical protein